MARRAGLLPRLRNRRRLLHPVNRWMPQ
jgi:hypothetical protein